MGVSDRVMDSVEDTYVPSYRKVFGVLDEDDGNLSAEPPPAPPAMDSDNDDGPNNPGDDVADNNYVAQNNRWKELKDTEEHHRLVTALKNHWQQEQE